MRYIIPINEDTQPLLAELNGGVEPEIGVQTYFIYDSDPDGQNVIVSDNEVWRSGGLVDQTYSIFRVMPIKP